MYPEARATKSWQKYFALMRFAQAEEDSSWGFGCWIGIGAGNHGVYDAALLFEDV